MAETLKPYVLGEVGRMNWQHSIEAARMLAGVGDSPSAPGRPRQAMLRRAVSAAYYAMFNALCQSNADVLVGISSTGQDAQLWLDTFRALQHNVAKNRLEQYANTSRDPVLRTFARAFGKLQEQRITADYDPTADFLRSQVFWLIDEAETATSAFQNLPARTRRTLALHLLVRRRN